MRDSRSASPAGADVVLAAVAGTCAAVALLVWAWGGIAGLLFHGLWTPAHAEDLLPVALRLPAHLSDPSSAWPPRLRADLPGPLGAYVTLALVIPAAWLSWRAAMSLAGPVGRTGAGARWAAAGDLRALVPPRRASPRRTGSNAPAASRSGCRLGLGRRNGRLLRAEHRHALVAFGPPQSGKSAGLAVPALLEWDGPAVASSIKTDLLACTRRRRAASGEVLVFDPFELAGEPGHTWSPLRGARTWDGALEVAGRIAAAGELDQRGVEGGDFWALAAEQRLAPLLYAASRTDGDMGTVLGWAYGQGSRGLDEALEGLLRRAGGEQDRRDAGAAYEATRAFAAQADRTRSSVEATVQAMLRAYRFSSVARSAAGCEITPERLLQGRSTLYLIGDAKASKLLRPLFLALLQEVVDFAYESATRAGGALPVSLLLCLDEAGNVAPLPNLAEIASTAPSHNIQLVTIFHDMAQARSRYRGQAETVVNSHRARMLLPGVADLETLRYFSGLLGEEEARELTHTWGSGGSSRSRSIRRRPLLAPEALRQLPEREALLLYGRLPPTRLTQRRWYADRRLRRLADAPAHDRRSTRYERARRPR